MAYITKFKDVGSIISSTDQFGAKMFEVASTHFGAYARGVFVGTGSGVVAQHFIDADIPFSFVEKHPDFVQLFKEKFGRKTDILGGDFFELPLDESRYGLSNSLIVSCMPVTGPFFSERLVTQFAAALEQGSTIIQMSYIPLVRKIELFRQLQDKGFHIERSATVFFNIPPASIFTLRQPGTCV